MGLNKDELKETMKTEFLSALGVSIAKLSTLEIRPNQIPARPGTSAISAAGNPNRAQSLRSSALSAAIRLKTRYPVIEFKIADARTWAVTQNNLPVCPVFLPSLV